MRSVIVIAIISAAVALGACRREVPAEPMKLGATPAPAVQVTE